MNSQDVNTHNLICDFGKHKGERWTRIPVGYLKWICSEPSMSEQRKQVARSELKRRGTVTPKVQISGHAIDRASLHHRKTWHENKREDEGLHAWLARVSVEAITQDIRDKQGNYLHLGICFCFEQDGDWPVLKTVKQQKRKIGPVIELDEAASSNLQSYFNDDSNWKE